YAEEGINGIIEGNWDYVFQSEFNGLKTEEPLFWTGSADVLEKYYKNNGTKIGFGQCWVFTGVLISMLRALGIPSRPVTVGFSGVALDNDLKIDYEEKNGELVYPDKNNFIWNFHVWVQASMQRLDMGTRYAGWQEVDPTYAKGPVSHRSIYESEINSTDLAYFYAAINADEASWNNGTLLRINTNSFIVTPNITENEDIFITRSFKPEEGTNEERLHYLNATRSLGVEVLFLKQRRKRSIKNKAEDYLLINPIEPVSIGDPLSFVITMKNPTLKTLVFRLSLKVNSVFNNLTVAHVIRNSTTTHTINSKQNVDFYEKIEFPEYKSKLVSSKTLSINAIIEGNGETFSFDTQMITFLTPHIKLEYLRNYKGECEHGESSISDSVGDQNYKKHDNASQIAIKVSLENPVSFVLNNARISMEGIRCDRRVYKIGRIQANDEIGRTLCLTCQRSSAIKESIVAFLISDDLDDVKGQTSIGLLQ
ncbi:hemocyte protein-glutamine gamma-glutamyltransferase-like isoform X1, partial [Dinothrombium tinctorium]